MFIVNGFMLIVNKRYNCSIMNTIKTKIKLLAVSRGITLKKLAQMLFKYTNENYSYNSLLGKLNRESLSLKEAIYIGDLLNYKLEFTDIVKK